MPKFCVRQYGVILRVFLFLISFLTCGVYVYIFSGLCEQQRSGFRHLPVYGDFVFVLICGVPSVVGRSDPEAVWDTCTCESSSYPFLPRN